MNFERILLVAVGALAASLTVVAVKPTGEPLASANTIPAHHDTPQAVRPLDEVKRRLASLERSYLAAQNSAPGAPADQRVARLETELESMRSDIAHLLRASQEPAREADEYLPVDGDAHALSEDDLFADYESQREDIMAEYEAALSAAHSSPAVSATVEASVTEIAGDEMLAGSALVATECRGVHCRLEFSHDSVEARDNLAANVALFLPAGTSSVVMPLGDSNDSSESVVYLTLAAR